MGPRSREHAWADTVVEEGGGIFTLKDATALIRVSGDLSITYESLRTLVRGTRSHDAFIEPSHPFRESRMALDFQNVIELYVIRKLRDRGIPMQRIKKLRPKLARLLGSERPFATTQLLTLGRDVFLSMGDDEDVGPLLDIWREQQAMPKILRPLLTKIDLDKRLWWPVGRSQGVVVDPRRKFGAPILEQSGIHTSILYDVWVAERKNTRRVAWMYELTPATVNRALRFEERFRGERKAA